MRKFLDVLSHPNIAEYTLYMVFVAVVLLEVTHA